MATTLTKSDRSSNALIQAYLDAQDQLLAARKRFADRVRQLFDALPSLLAKRAVAAGPAQLANLDKLVRDTVYDAIDLMKDHVLDLLFDVRRVFQKSFALPVEQSLAVLAAIAGVQRNDETKEVLTEQLEVEDLLRQFRRGNWDGSVAPGEAARLVARLAFPPPSRADVERALRTALPGGLDWDARLRKWSEPARSQILAQLIDGMSSGENVTELERRLRPITGPLAYKAWRIANTEAGKVMMRDYQSRLANVADIVDGQQIVATLDERTRPEHAERHGRIYWKLDDGTYRAENGDLMPDLPDAPNCRCILVPVLKSVPEAGKQFVQTADNNFVIDNLSYADWWARASERERIKAVGRERYEVAKQIRGGVPDWLDFLDLDGKLLSVEQLRSEHPALRQLRRQQLEERILAQSLQYRDVFARLSVADPLEVPRISRELGWSNTFKERLAYKWALMRMAEFAGPEGRAVSMSRTAWSKQFHTAAEAVAEALRRADQVPVFKARTRQAMERLLLESSGNPVLIAETALELAGFDWPPGFDNPNPGFYAVSYVHEALFLPPGQHENLSGLPMAPVVRQVGVDHIIERGMNWLEKLCRRGIRQLLVGRNVRFSGITGRPFYDRTTKEIQLSRNARPEVAVHELTHALEDLIPNFAAQMIVYRARATAGAQPVPIPNMPGETYRPRTDGREWVNEYQGKVYPFLATEVATITMEYLMVEPIRALRADPDLVELVLSFLR